MNLTLLIAKELRERAATMVTCLLAITLGVAAVVAVRSISIFSEQVVSHQMASLGANILLIPQAANLQDYYGADMHGLTLPEEHAGALALANLEGVEKICPKLCLRSEVEGREVTLTGILPQNELQDKTLFAGTQAFSHKHVGCRGSHSANAPTTADSLATHRFVQELGEYELLVGSELAERWPLKKGNWLTLYGKEFRVGTVLPPTGTADDSRLFMHLHTMQELAKTGEVVNVIEIIACCKDAAGNLTNELKSLFPDAKVATISQVVQAQVGVTRLMATVSWLLLAVLVLVGGGSIAGTMYANVHERRKEIGTLMALGASPGFVSRLILGKALFVGIVGGVLGYIVGSGLAWWLGTQLVGLAVLPTASLAIWALVLATGISIMASYLPARRASRLDPCVCFQEI
jgi:putative ABC transport system permease protein